MTACVACYAQTCLCSLHNALVAGPLQQTRSHQILFDCRRYWTASACASRSPRYHLSSSSTWARHSTAGRSQYLCWSPMSCCSHKTPAASMLCLSCTGWCVPILCLIAIAGENVVQLWVDLYSLTSLHSCPCRFVPAIPMISFLVQLLTSSAHCDS